MKAYSIVLSGRWGHFRRPEANNNPITYDFIPKTAFIGLIAAVVGMKRDTLKKKYEKLCNSIFYNVEILNPIAKIVTNFRIYKYKGSLSSVENPPQFYEILQEPKYQVVFFGDNKVIELFVKNLKTEQSAYTPTFGLVNCPVNINSLEEIEIQKIRNHEVLTKGFIPFGCQLKLKSNITISYDSIPVVQNNNWFNVKYVKVFYGYVPEGKSFKVRRSNYEHQYISNSLGYFFI